MRERYVERGCVHATAVCATVSEAPAIYSEETLILRIISAHYGTVVRS